MGLPGPRGQTQREALILAARRAGIKRILLPEENLKNLKDLPPAAQNEMVFYGVETIDEAIPLVISAINRITKGSSADKKQTIPATAFPPTAGLS